MKLAIIERIPAYARAGAYLVAILGVPGAVLLTPTAHAATGGSRADRLQASWRDAVTNTPVPREGCFTATYPVAAWKPVACTVAPAIPLVPRSTHPGNSGLTVGDGDDYSAVVTGLISKSVGTFPTTTGLKTETGDGQANSYSLQLNSQFFYNSPACAGAKNPASCQGWQQFAYLPGYGFMQYWLLNYANTCPSGWMSYGSDCYRNSASVPAPSVVIKKLKTLSISGQAVANGLDTLIFFVKNKGYTTTGKDSVVGLASFWNASEWGIFGPGGGSEADFNKGTSIAVNIALTDGSTEAPVCQANDGTTGETNNLNLGPCTATGGSTPSVAFTESLAK